MKASSINQLQFDSSKVGAQGTGASDKVKTGKALTDKAARDQWDRFDPVLMNVFVGGIQGSSDSGF